MRDNRYGKETLSTEKLGCGNETAQMAISSYLDGEATGLEKTLAEWHLAECRECNRLLGRWSLDAGALRHSAHDPEMEMLAGAIAGQTRQWLWNDLLAAPIGAPVGTPIGAPVAAQPAPLQLVSLRPAATVPARFRPLKSSFVAAMMVVITVLGVSLGALLSNATFQAAPVVAPIAATVDKNDFPVTTGPAAFNKAATSGATQASVTPAAPQPSLALLYSAASQTRAPQLAGSTPFLGYVTPYTAFTPGVGRGEGGSGN